MVNPKKKYGQHFLIDKNIATKIVNSLTNKNNYNILEIGPGEGVLTDLIIKKSKKLSIVEIDTEAVTFLKSKYSNSNIEIINDDFLKIDLNKVFKFNQFCIIGNFPYNISSQIFFKVLSNKSYIPELVCMIQKEVAERISSPSNCKNYGILSVLLQLYYKTDYLFQVNESVFRPRPNVKSAVIRLRRYRAEIENTDEELLFKIVKACFNQRRKTIKNSIKKLDLFDKEHSNFDSKYLKLRPEQLLPEDFVNLTNELSDYLN